MDFSGGLFLLFRIRFTYIYITLGKRYLNFLFLEGLEDRIIDLTLKYQWFFNVLGCPELKREIDTTITETIKSHVRFR